MRRSIVTLAAIISALAGCVLNHTDAPQTKRVGINSTTVTYQEQGRGRSIVFVHGAITDYRVWDGQREAVAAAHHPLLL